MSLWITQSLLSNWIYFLDSDDAKTDAAYRSFLDSVHRRPKKVSKAMQTGIDFENAINNLVAGRDFEHRNDKWDAAVRKFANRCAGGQSQTPLTGKLSVSGYDFTLYGICDYVKAGIIYDIKKVTRYEYGKYLNSPQHPMYLYLLPEAIRFDYLIFDGAYCYSETYRRNDCKPIEQIIREFINFLEQNKLIDTYIKNWTMNSEREDKINGVYKRGE